MQDFSMIRMKPLLTLLPLDNKLTFVTDSKKKKDKREECNNRQKIHSLFGVYPFAWTLFSFVCLHVCLRAIYGS